MNAINKSILLLVCFGVLSCNASSPGIKSSNAQIIQGLKEQFEKKYNAHDADETINGIVQKTLKDCGIKRHVIVLQRDGGDNSYTCSEPFKHSQEFIVVGTKEQSLDQITFAVYHEVGHVAHGDVLKKKQLLDRRLIDGTMGLSLLAGLAAGFKFNKHIKIPLASVVVGGLAAVTTAVAGLWAIFYKESLKELRADAFAYRHLVKHGKLNIAIGQISDYLHKHEFEGITPLPSFVCGYPNDFQRAKEGVNVLQKQGINISYLIKNLPEDLDQGIKEHFPDQIQRFFPDFA